MSFFSSLFGSTPAGNVQTPSYISPAAYGMAIPGTTTAAPTGAIDPNAVGGQYYSGTGGLGQYNVYGSLLPQAMNIGQGMINDPSAFSYLQGARTGAGLGTGAAFNQYGAGANLYGLGGPTIATAFDPQNALYNQTLQQMMQQAQGGLAGSGVLNTPYGQSVLGQDLGNFNINWQNAQQQRQLAGINALSQLYPQAAQMQASAAPLFMQSAAYPWQTGQQIGGANIGTLGTLGGFGSSASQIPQQQLQNYLALMGWGTGAQQQAFGQAQQANFLDPMAIASAQNAYNQNLFQDQLARAQAQAQESTAAWTGIGQLAGGIGGFGLGMGPKGFNIFGSPGGSSTSVVPTAQYGAEPEAGQPHYVGEAGPELFIPRTAGTIVPNPHTQQQMAGFGGMGAAAQPPSGAGSFMPGMPGGRGGEQPYPLGGIGTFKPQFGRGWQYGGGAG